LKNDKTIVSYFVIAHSPPSFIFWFGRLIFSVSINSHPDNIYMLLPAGEYHTIIDLIQSTHEYRGMVNDCLTSAVGLDQSIIDQVRIVMSRPH
jgi:hypothetical protein